MTVNEKQDDVKGGSSAEPINWRQGFANAIAVVGLLAAVLGGYLSLKAVDKDYDLNTSVSRYRAETIFAISKQSVDQYRTQLSAVRSRIIDLESKIEKIDPEAIQKDQESGVLLSGENLKLSKEVQVGLEDLNKEVFRLPEGLAASVNQARAELFNRFQSKVFDKHYPRSGAVGEQPNPFFCKGVRYSSRTPA